jgi:hypothetical protein
MSAANYNVVCILTSFWAAIFEQRDSSKFRRNGLSVRSLYLLISVYILVLVLSADFAQRVSQLCIRT